MERLSASTARIEFAEILNKVRYRGERIVFHRRGKDVAAMVPIEDIQLLEALEDKLDLEAIKHALEEPWTTSWADVKKKLGL